MPSKVEENSQQVCLDFSFKSTWCSVQDLVGQAQHMLERHFPQVFVTGELDSVKLHSNGHVYFTLKDDRAALPAVMWRSQLNKLSFTPQNGLHVRITGRLGLYEPQAKFQLYVDQMTLDGHGEMQRALEELKRRLQEEGLFATERKRPLPLLPRRVGIATSLDGAVLRDIARVAKRRGRVSFLVAPCVVQGETAHTHICAAIRKLEPWVDVIIVARGGGSSTDLWAFNHEQVVRTIAACKVPVVSAVGHEVDFTLADFAADVRAPTPSAAAERVVPDFAVLESEQTDLTVRLQRASQRLLETARQRLDVEQTRLFHAMHRLLTRQKQTLVVCNQQLTQQHPRAQLGRHQQALLQKRASLQHAWQRIFSANQHGFHSLVATLDALSPLQVMGRGYSVVYTAQGGILADSRTVKPGDAIHLRLHQGRLDCHVHACHHSETT